MATTKNGRIRKLIKNILNKKSRVTNKKTPECYITINYYQLGVKEDERRKLELERLEIALGKPQRNPTTGGLMYDSPLKKIRMRKFAHKKQVAKDDTGKKKKGKG